ncbi:hypothetical protein E3P99_02106 [Wallemia hederae]|uniref:Cation efflux protein cytoplasmic domain-containing protein n=1 Tax=Wallemia hederae TaxID=1540922 RepID=A0A4T0FM33_9BASI|nr:hypothetical protein E3P99_02106 [Wallemia hederae]
MAASSSYKKAKAKFTTSWPFYSYAPAQTNYSNLPCITHHPLNISEQITADFQDADEAQVFIPPSSSVDLARRANLFGQEDEVEKGSVDPADVERWIEAYAKDRWKRFSPEEAEPYLPHNPPITVAAGSVHSTSDFTFNRFDKASLEDTSKSPGCVFNAGGSVMSLDWQRRSRHAPPLSPSTLAVSVLVDNSTKHAIGAQDTKAYKSSIQLWLHTPRQGENGVVEPAKVSLAAVLCTDKGLPIDLQFSPTDAPHMEYNDSSRVTAGALAVTFNNGDVDVALLPDILLLRKYYGVADDEVLYLNYTPTLALSKPHTKGLELEWASSNRLAVGFSNGSVGVYDTRAALRERQTSVRPRAYFDVHFGGVNGLQWVQIPPSSSKSPASRTFSSDSEYTQLLSSGYDGSFCVSDVRVAGSGNNGAPVMFEHVRGITYTVGYSIQTNSIICGNAENTVLMQGLLASDYKRGSQLTDFGCAILDIATSTCHPFIAVCGVNGHVEVINPIATVEARHKRQNMYYSMDVFGIEWGRKEGKYQMIDHLNPPNNRQDNASKGGKGSKLKVIDREDLARFSAPFPTEQSINAVKWNPEVSRSAILASGMMSGMVRLDELWDVKETMNAGTMTDAVHSTTRFGIVLGISCVFFVSELVVGLKTRSLALIADSFHYLSDLVAYIIAFTAAYLREHGKRLPGWTYGWHRAELVGAFFNGVFLLGLALSIFLQSIERFFNPETVDQPLAVVILGAVGLALNIVSAAFVHDHHGHSHGGHSHGKGHSHSHKHDDHDEHTHPDEEEGLMARHSHDDDHDDHDSVTHDNESEDMHQFHNHVRLPPPIDAHGDLGMFGVFLHVVGDAINNIGVIIVGVLIMKLKSEHRFYADPAASLVISIIIFASAIPLTLKTARILLEVAPKYLDLQAIESDLLSLPNVLSIHDHHIWHLSQSDLLATLHVRVPSTLTLTEWHTVEREMRMCLAGFGINHVTIEVEADDVVSRGCSEGQITRQNSVCSINN